MTTRRSRLVLAAVTFLCAAGLQSVAHAGVSGQIVDVTSSSGTAEVVLEPLPLGRGEVLAPTSVAASVGGQPVTAELMGTERIEVAAPTREVILVLDTSGSMQGDRLLAAKAAATAFLDAAPADLRIGLVTFAKTAQVRTKPTLDRTVTRATIAGLQAEGPTSLYDGVQAALRTLGPSQERRLMVLSDGADTASTSSLSAVVTAVRQAKVPVDAAEVGGDVAARAALTEIARVAGGRVVASVDAGQLTRTFVQAASMVPSRVTVRLPLPSEASRGSVPLEVTITSRTGRVSGAASVDVPRAAAPVAKNTGDSDSLPSWLLVTGLVSIFLAAVLAVAAASTAGVSRSTRARQLVMQYTMAPGPAPTAPDSVLMEKGPVARAAVELADKVAKRRNMEAGLTLALDRAAIAWQPSEWLVMQGCLALTALAGAILVGYGPLVGLVLAAVAGWLLPKLLLKVRFARRRKAFTAGMPDALQLVAGSLTTGYSLAQALDASVQEGAQPVSGELGRALAEARLGVPLEDALEVVADRMDSEDFRWVVMAVRVQRDVGGNLAEVLSKVCVTMRDRASLRRQVRALSAEGRISAYVLIALPIFLGFYLFMVNRDYFRPMYTELPGMIALGYTAFSLVLGAVWMNKLVKVEM